MFPINRFPYTSFTNINLDWILRKLKEQVSSAVTSVCGKTGDVVLDANDVGALPDSYTPPVTSVNGNTGAVTTHDLIPGGTTGQVLSKIDGTDYNVEWKTPSGGGGGAVDSVNGQTGTVVLDANDVGALPDTYTAPVTSVNSQTGAVTITVPTKTSDLVNDSGFITSAPVTSVNSQTGAVTITVPTKTSDLVNDSGFITTSQAVPWTLSTTISNSGGVNQNAVIPSGAKEILLYIYDSTATQYRTSIVIPASAFPSGMESRYWGITYPDPNTPGVYFSKWVYAYYSSGVVVQTDSTNTTIEIYYR